MQLYRITSGKYLEDYSGHGGSFHDGGRWNSPGHPAIYMALSVSTALLEMANYVSSPQMIPPGHQLGVYELPDNLPTHEITVGQLPDDWHRFPYPLSTQSIGDNWLDNQQELALFVPSVAAPLGIDRIALINPLHPEIKELRLVESTHEMFNKRTFQQ